MKMRSIIRPFVFTKQAMCERMISWVAEVLNLFGVIIYIITLGYVDPPWKFVWLNYMRAFTVADIKSEDYGAWRATTKK